MGSIQNNTFWPYPEIPHFTGGCHWSAPLTLCHSLCCEGTYCLRHWRNIKEILERATGIEPACSAWEADALPLSYARVRLSLSQLAGRVIPRNCGENPALPRAILAIGIAVYRRSFNPDRA